MSDIECPYCNEGQEINHDDGYGYSESETHLQQCGSCEKTFAYNTSIIFHYDATTCDCQNGGEHDFKPTLTFPRECARMRCTMCDEERPMTESERLEVVG